MGKYTASVVDHLVVPVQVRLPPAHEEFLRRSGQPVPAPASLRLLIDTGSKRTTLIPGILGHLQPTPNSECRIVTALGALTTGLFWISLEFPDTRLAPFPEVLVARLPMPAALSQFHGLLGRDLLRRWESFEYEGRRGCYTVRDKPGPLIWLRRWF